MNVQPQYRDVIATYEEVLNKWKTISDIDTCANLVVVNDLIDARCHRGLNWAYCIIGSRPKRAMCTVPLTRCIRRRIKLSRAINLTVKIHHSPTPSLKWMPSLISYDTPVRIPFTFAATVRSYTQEDVSNLYSSVTPLPRIAYEETPHSLLGFTWIRTSWGHHCLPATG